MKLIYLAEANLKDRLTIQNFVFNFKIKEKTLLIHDSFGGTVKDTRFVTKRISSLLSEAMVYNNAFSADQRDLFFMENGELKLKKASIEKLLNVVPLLVLGPVIKNEAGEPVLADGQEMIEVARQAFQPDELLVFVDNPMSPLGSKRALIEAEADIEPFLKVYEEEKSAMERALKLAPARLVAPGNYSG
jgi:hypothetical protein